MRKVTKNINDVPLSLQNQANLLQNINRTSSESLKYDFADVRAKLNEIYKGKCAYCEQRLTMTIDHYRPKSSVAVQDLAYKQTHGGYYWLKAEWTNLLLACYDCNRNGVKGTRFPIKDKRNRISAPTDFSIQVLDEIEQPLLINPEVTNPANHLRVKKDGHLYPIQKSDKGKVTMEICKLDREPLLIKRQEIIDNFKNRIDFQLRQRYLSINPLTTEQLEAQLFLIFEDIAKQCTEEMEFTLIGYSIISYFKDMILDDIEEPFRKEVNDAFIKFCQTI
jgi:5-methylcytosine-specific restriction endonuclease McrA